jgi:integrase
MARAATGYVRGYDSRDGRSYALRFRAYGRREYLTLGSTAEGWTRQRAEEELENVLAHVRRGLWQVKSRDVV